MTLMECNAKSAEDCAIFSTFAEQRWTVLFRGPLILNAVKRRRYFVDTSCTKIYIYVEIHSHYSRYWPRPKLRGRPIVVTPGHTSCHRGVSYYSGRKSSRRVYTVWDALTTWRMIERQAIGQKQTNVISHRQQII